MAYASARPTNIDPRPSRVADRDWASEPKAATHNEMVVPEQFLLRYV